MFLIKICENLKQKYRFYKIYFDFMGYIKQSPIVGVMKISRLVAIPKIWWLVYFIVRWRNGRRYMFWKEIGMIHTLYQIKDFTGSSPVLTTRVLTPSKVMTHRKDDGFLLLLGVKYDLLYTFFCALIMDAHLAKKFSTLRPIRI